MRIQSEGCTALHAACRSGCGPCVEALLRHEAQDIPMNLSWFSATWDRAFHPWMLTNLAHDETSTTPFMRCCPSMWPPSTAARAA